MKRAFKTRLLVDPIQAFGLSGKHLLDTSNARIHGYLKLLPGLLAAGRTRLPRR